MTTARGSRRRTFCAAGVLLAAAVSVGFIIVRGAVSGGLTHAGWLMSDFADELATYMYVMGTTFLLGLVLGWRIGNQTDELQRQSMSDALTGLANRRYLWSRLSEELERATRYGLPLSLLLIDVDFFKKINDTGGHGAGDEALRRIADCLRNACRSLDVPARFGGDEFAILAPSTSADEACELANRLRQILAQATHGAPLTLSIGIADATAIDQGTPESLYAAADTALYRAKAHGRDRSVMARQSSFDGRNHLRLVAQP